MNIAQAIASRAAAGWPAAPALGLGDRGFTYAQLDDVAGRLAAFLRSHGVAEGEIVGIAMPTTPLHLLTILALARLGAVSLSLPAGLPAARRTELARAQGVGRVVCSSAALAPEGLPHLAVPRGWDRDTRLKAVPPVAVAAQAAWRIALSSGTTGAAKGVLLAHGPTIEFLRLFPSVVPSGAGPGTRALCFRGLETAFSLRSSLRHLLAGGAVVFARGALPKHAIAALGENQVSHATVSPPLLRSLVAALPPGGPHFPRLAHLAVGGTTLPAALGQAARERITPHLYSQYGATELGLIAIADPGLQQGDPSCAGRLVQWIEAQAVDEDGRPLPEGATGVLRFRGPGLAAGYNRDPETTARTFRDGWFHPGDRGRIAGGLLYLEGRQDDLVNVGGEKIDPVAVERALEAHPEVSEAAVFGMRGKDGRERLCAAVVLRHPVSAHALVKHCSDALGPRRAPAQFFPVRALPRNENGKILRREIQRRAERRAAP